MSVQTVLLSRVSTIIELHILESSFLINITKWNRKEVRARAPHVHWKGAHICKSGGLLRLYLQVISLITFLLFYLCHIFIFYAILYHRHFYLKLFKLVCRHQNQTKPTDFGWQSVGRLLLFISTVAIFYYYQAPSMNRKWPSRPRQKLYIAVGVMIITNVSSDMAEIWTRVLKHHSQTRCHWIFKTQVFKSQ